MATFRYAIKVTLPVMAGFLFLGIAYGILMSEAGFSPWWSFFVSLFVYAGSLQFALVTFLAGGTPLLTVALMSLFINARHMFYGLSFVDDFKAFPWWARGYFVFSLSDETYSLLYAEKQKTDFPQKRAWLMIAVLNHFYWILGSLIGGLIGKGFTLDFTGIDFAMTALFVVILVEQFQKSHLRTPALIGLAVGLSFLLLFGAEYFLLPALFATVILLFCLQEAKARKEGSKLS